MYFGFYGSLSSQLAGACILTVSSRGLCACTFLGSPPLLKTPDYQVRVPVL